MKDPDTKLWYYSIDTGRVEQIRRELQMMTEPPTTEATETTVETQPTPETTLTTEATERAVQTEPTTELTPATGTWCEYVHEKQNYCGAILSLLIAIF